MKVDSGKYCNFIPVLEITEVVPASDWSDDLEYACDFVINVREHKPPNPEDFEARPPNRSTMRSWWWPAKQENPREQYEAAMLEYKLRPRPYYLRAMDVVERNEWMRDIRRATRLAKIKAREAENMSNARKLQKQIKAGYQTQYVQGTSSVLILANFCANAYEAQTRPQPNSEEDVLLRKFDLAFTVIFTVELVWNMAAHW